MVKKNPKDITNVMIMEAIHDMKADIGAMKADIGAIREDMSLMEIRLENRMDAMEVRLTKRIVDESNMLAAAMIPTNKQLASDIEVIKKHVGLAH